ncbi:MAG: NADH-quinone oxidoreductase subunit NuoE [Alphaproteobacteria bacterium]|nr:NADH-quinone oxidoreductase subunit NuoE [Alphaproteobacteria bacterium]
MSSDVPFSFSPESLERARVILARYPEGRQASGVIPLLDLAQRQNDGWLSRPAMDAVAEFLEMAPILVYEVASLFTMFNLQPVGEHHVQVCTNLPCWLRGSDQVVEGCRKSLGIDIGETTADGKFTLSEVECAGACVNAPVAQIGDHYYEDLDADGIATVLEALKRGETPSHGSQTGRQTSAPAGGPTTLKTATGEA